MIMKVFEATVTFNFMVERPDGPLGVAVYHEKLLRFILCISQGPLRGLFRLLK